MPPLWGLALLGAAGFAAFKLVRREMARVEARLSEAARRPDDQTIRLERDPVTGRYRPEGEA
ncbi:hypothetical protein GWI72_11580 [Microvirga tunisiensis]|uniref:Uncharacterized protein n=2 Tax=Pannonibacter tanglangensis TaxID=2750084 RepID=A0ABW9ZHN3_9HYPH|nr:MULTISPECIES: hypothetical protein [unclassified Pannonibacter]NBN64373.1 hypothetical protein [Pannonibacter sp. XCT-34]NBN78907.1 hypothetical protein [Pannonibacter sp. XCT-53]